ncbi:hypothetical protein B0H19DRAFT_140152 [Mycena capillaripes]|nr:hypothetical protein B0H19DRAFT_140152 [Mycena capillaripes]
MSDVRSKVRPAKVAELAAKANLYLGIAPSSNFDHCLNRAMQEMSEAEYALSKPATEQPVQLGLEHAFIHYSRAKKICGHLDSQMALTMDQRAKLAEARKKKLDDQWDLLERALVDNYDKWVSFGQDPSDAEPEFVAAARREGEILRRQRAHVDGVQTHEEGCKYRLGDGGGWVWCWHDLFCWCQQPQIQCTCSELRRRAGAPP